MITVDTDIETGSLSLWQVCDDTIRVLPWRDYNHAGRNWTAIWCHFRIRGATGRRITLEFLDLADEWQHTPSFAWGPHTRPVYSHDGQTWHRFTDVAYHQARQQLTVRHTAQADELWVAYIEPYGVERLNRLLHDLAGSPGVAVDTVGTSVEGRDLSRVTVGDPAADRPRVLVIARQHPWETGTSYAAEGLLRFLTSDDAKAKQFRERLTFIVMPMLNPDGVLRGGTRYNARGYDPMRDLDQAGPDDSRETWHMLGAMREARAAGQGSDLILNLHNNNQEARDLVAAYGLPANDPRLLSIGHAIARHTHFRGEIMAWHHPNASIPLEYGFGVLLELQTGYIRALDRYVTAEDQMAYGRGLAFAADDHFAMLGRSG